MLYVWATLLVLLNVVWLLGIVAGIPGTWLMVAGAALLTWLHRADADIAAPVFSIATLVILVVLAAVGELVEFLGGVAGSKHAGGTRRGALGAIVGGFFGAMLAIPLIPLPVIGSLLGACVGAALGAGALELHGGMKLDASLRSGMGAGKGVLIGRAGKLVVGAIIWLWIAIAAYWP